MLSGFFITGLLRREIDRTGSIDLIAFWGRRARRLLPAAALVGLSTVVAGSLLTEVLDARRFAIDGLYTSVFAMNWRSVSVGTSYLADPDPSPFLHYWSLGVEEQFYLVWPVLLLALAVVCRHRPRSISPALAGLAGLVGVVSFVIALRQTHGAQPFAYFATYARIWQLALGGLLAVATPLLARPGAAARLVCRWAGLAAIVLFYLDTPLDVIYPGWYALPPTFGAALIVAAGVPRSGGTDPSSREPVARILGAGPMQAVGQYSYGWYLWHWPPLVLLPLALDRPLITSELVACAGLTLGLAVLSFHLLEQPVRSSTWLGAVRGRRSLAMGLALVGATALASQSAAMIATWQAGHTSTRSAAGIRLDPQPAAAAAERPRPTSDGCEVSLSSNALSGDCRYRPDTGRGDVLLLGDSHAVQWFPGVDAMARRHHWGLRVWARASCPLADVTKVAAGGPARACDRWRNDVMRRAIAAHPSLVLVAGYASVVPSLYDRGQHRIVGGARARQLYQDGLEHELGRLRAAGIRVLLIRDNPSFDVAAPKCVLAHERHVSLCSAPRRHALRTAADLNAAKAVPGVHWLDLTRVFCSATRCHQVIGATLAYRDTNHLTIEMIMRLRPRLEAAALRTIAPKPR